MIDAAIPRLLGTTATTPEITGNVALRTKATTTEVTGASIITREGSKTTPEFVGMADCKGDTTGGVYNTTGEGALRGVARGV